MKFNPFLAILVSMMLAGCGKETSVAPTPTEEPSKEVSVAPTITENPITIPGLNFEIKESPQTKLANITGMMKTIFR